MEDKIRARIAELERIRDDVRAQAERQLSAISGGIAELKELLEPPKAPSGDTKQEPTTPVAEALVAAEHPQRGLDLPLVAVQEARPEPFTPLVPVPNRTKKKGKK